MFEVFFIFIPWEMIQFDEYFSDGLKPPTMILDDEWLLVNWWQVVADKGPGWPGDVTAIE